MSRIIAKLSAYFDQAIQLDPELCSGLCRAFRSVDVYWRSDRRSDDRVVQKRGAMRRKAVAIAPDLAEAHAALGWVRFFVEWKFAEGLERTKACERTFSEQSDRERSAGASRSFIWGELTRPSGRRRQAVELDPLSVIAQSNLARVLFYAGKLDEADAVARKVGRVAAVCCFQSSMAGARSLSSAATARQPCAKRNWSLTKAIAVSNSRSRNMYRGDRQAADAALADLIANGRDRLAYQIAQVYAVRGETDKAFEWLQIAFDNHDTGTLSLLVDPLLRGLRDDPRYKNLLVKLGLPTTS